MLPALHFRGVVELLLCCHDCFNVLLSFLYSAQRPRVESAEHAASLAGTRSTNPETPEAAALRPTARFLRVESRFSIGGGINGVVVRLNCSWSLGASFIYFPNRIRLSANWSKTFWHRFYFSFVWQCLTEFFTTHWTGLASCPKICIRVCQIDARYPWKRGNTRV